MKEKFYRWLSNKLPVPLVYFCGIRIWAVATTGEYSNQEASSLTVVEALDRFYSD